MAINSVMRAALKALSYPDLNIKKNYQLIRTITNATHVHMLKPFYRTWDHRVPTASGHNVPVRIYVPNQDISERYLDNSHPVLLFFHGGGWVTGNIDSYDKVCTNLSISTGHTVVSVDYRLAPEYPFPIGFDDCYAVASEVFLHTGLLNAREDEVTLIGDSAGGNLAAAISLKARDTGDFMPRRQILLYPATGSDHHPETSGFDSVRENGTGYLLTSKRVCDYMELYQRTDEDRENPYFAPLMAKDFSRQPDTLVITCEFDPLRDEGEEYARQLRQAGNQVVLRRFADALHGFFSLPPQFPQVQDAYRLINQFLRGETVEEQSPEEVEPA